jgi:glycosyltransferase involved in cell wall biosynthesis
MTDQQNIKTIAIVTSIAFSVANFRGPLIRRMVGHGIKVYTLAPDFDATTREAVRALGAEPVDISLERTGLKPMRDLADTVRLSYALRRLRPDLIFCYFIKPVIYGAIAARLAGVERRYALVAGLGYVFTPDGTHDAMRRRALRTLGSALYGIAFRHYQRVFLQNPDDRDLLCDAGMLPRNRAVLVSGSGVDLARFVPSRPIVAPVTFVLVARLLREKGIVEYVNAARRIKESRPDTVFRLLGDVDDNPGGLAREQVAAWVADGIIEWPGQVPNVIPWLASSSVFVLPSYREGKPRSTQEAMAMGLPVVTTDAPGCRDTVEEGVNGFKVPVRDARALETALRRFVDNPDLIAPMGRESRLLAEQLFDVDQINSIMLQEMGIEAATDSSDRGRQTPSLLPMCMRA